VARKSMRTPLRRPPGAEPRRGLTGWGGHPFARPARSSGRRLGRPGEQSSLATRAEPRCMLARARPSGTLPVCPTLRDPSRRLMPLRFAFIFRQPGLRCKLTGPCLGAFANPSNASFPPRCFWPARTFPPRALLRGVPQPLLVFVWVGWVGGQPPEGRKSRCLFLFFFAPKALSWVMAGRLVSRACLVPGNSCQCTMIIWQPYFVWPFSFWWGAGELVCADR